MFMWMGKNRTLEAFLLLLDNKSCFRLMVAFSGKEVEIRMSVHV